MRALKMTQAHNPALGLYGDCVRTALACLLDCQTTDEVPHFFADYANDASDAAGWDRADEWLRRERGLALFYIGVPGEPVNDILLAMAESNPDTYFLLCGRSSNGGNHCVICLNGAVCHDPSWHNIGIVGPGLTGHYVIVVLIPGSLKK